MLIYLYGPDSYRRNSKLKELIEAYRAKYSQVDLWVADLGSEPEDWQKIREFLNQPSMFVESKVAVVREGAALPEASHEREWVKTLKKFLRVPKVSIIISSFEQPRAARKFLLEEPVTSQEFQELAGKELNHFLKKEMSKRNLDFSAEAAKFFTDFLREGGDRSWRAVNELDKIALAGFRTPISLTDVKAVLSRLRLGDVFYGARQILASGDYRKRAGFLEKLFLQNAEPAHLFNSLAYQARGKDVLRLADYDIAVKSGRLEYEEALTDFLIF